jgi:exodeoxyribonuclease V alpha subunit
MTSTSPSTAAHLLHMHRAAGTLSASDVQIASTLTRLAGDHHPEVALAAAFAAQAPRRGDVAVDLTRVRHDQMADADDPQAVGDLTWPEPQHWLEQLRRSPLVTAEPPALVVRQHLVYLQRYDDYEQRVAAHLGQRAAAVIASKPGPLSVAPDLLQGPGAEHQLDAVRRGRDRALSIIVGGPGTGKTTTVAALLAELVSDVGAHGPRPRVALAAPTGKAAARLGEALRAGARHLPDDVRALVANTPFSTLHRLLGWSTRGTPRHHRLNPLPHDVVIVDETSMVSLPLMARLLDAVRPDARLVLVGDPGQLASVDAGNVLGDVIEGGRMGPLNACLGELTVSRRFEPGSPLDRLARAVRDGRVDDAIEVLRDTHAHDETERDTVRGSVHWIPLGGDDPRARAGVVVDLDAVIDQSVNCAKAGDVPGALDALTRFRVLCAHRNGPFGVAAWNRWIESRLPAGGVSPSVWYPGRPVMVTRNDAAMGLFNGDLGVVVHIDGVPQVAFDATDTTGTADGVRLVPPARLDTVDTVHALTIHKSQGSEFTHVVVVLPPAGSRLSSRDLLYTAITRATHRVTVIGDAEAVAAAVRRRSHRTGALAERLAGIEQAPAGLGEVP